MSDKGGAGSAGAAPPPYTVLRGHSHEISVVRFIQCLEEPMRLITGDVSGFCNLWNVVTRRPVATFRACEEQQSALEVCSPCSNPSSNIIVSFVIIKKKKIEKFSFSFMFLLCVCV